jgi:FKBP-type peptidyl-prolyl cis-trans isomerase FklB
MNTCRARHPNFLLTSLAAVIVSGPPSVGAAETAPATAPPNPAAVTSEAGSYDVGLMLGSQLEHNGVVGIVSMDTVIRGLKDAVGGRAITTEERDTALRFMRDARDALTEKNRAQGREFLERNAKQPGVMTMTSGLQYRVIAEGDARGKSPSPTDDVTVRYRASLGDGKEIDRSDTHDRPATFRVNSVFKGWQEAFLAMKPGAKWQLFVPPELGYGSNPPPTVPPGALLIYELELLRIEPAAPMDPNAAAKRRVPVGGNPPAGTTTPR